MSKIIAVPFCAGEYLNFWKIVSVSDELYSQAILRNSGVLNITNRIKIKTELEKLLRAEKTRLMREQWSSEKAKASIKVFQNEKQYWKDLSTARLKIGTTVL